MGWLRIGLRPRAFISFLVFGNPDETLALVFEIPVLLQATPTKQDLDISGLGFFFFKIPNQGAPQLFLCGSLPGLRLRSCAIIHQKLDIFQEFGSLQCRCILGA